MSVVLQNTFTTITRAPEEARSCRKDNETKTVFLRMPNTFVGLLFYFFPIFFSIYLTSPGFLLPVTKGSPLLCSGCLPRWFARCSGRICIGWPTCCFPPPLSPTLLYLLFSLPSFLLSFTWNRSHPLWFTLSLPILSFSPLPVCSSAQPPPPVSLPPRCISFSPALFAPWLFSLYQFSDLSPFFSVV